MKKTLYIAEFIRDDYKNESIWFVAPSNLKYEQQEAETYKHIIDEYYDEDMTAQELRKWGVSIEGIYTIDSSMIKEVYESEAE